MIIDDEEEEGEEKKKEQQRRFSYSCGWHALAASVVGIG